MKSNGTLVLAVLAGVVFFANGDIFSVGSSGQSENGVPFAARDFYVRFRAYKTGVEDKLCGGVRVNEKWILTAAECLDNTIYSDVQITAFINKANLTSVFSSLRKLNYMVHGKFDNATKAYNLALVKTDYDNWSGNFNRARLLSRSGANNSFVNENAVITAYDLPADADGSRTLYLPSILVKIVESSRCEGLYFPSATKADQFCALPLYGKEVDNDDVGAPVTFSEFRKHTLVGIILSVTPSAEGEVQPIVIHKIAPHLQWLSNNTRTPLDD